MRGRPSLWLTVWILAVTVFAGCLAGDDEGDDVPPIDAALDHDAIARLIGTPIESEHDHRDPLDPGHWGGVNMELLAWHTLDVTLGENGFANFVFWGDADEDLLYIAIDGDTRAGFAIADISDPVNVSVVGSYFVDGSSVQEVRVFPGGDYALMNVQEIPSPGQFQDLEGDGDCTVCMHVVDVRDRTAPALSSVYPVDLLGTHNMDIHDVDGTPHVFYVGQSLFSGSPLALPGNYVGIARLVEEPTGARLVKVNEFRLTDVATDPNRSYPHDVIVSVHPLTGQRIAYVSHWDGGAVTVDVSNVLAPEVLGIHKDPAPSDARATHWFAPEPEARIDQLIAWSAPEIGQLDTGSGVIRAYDVTEPDDLRQLGTWTLPGNVTIPGKYVLSPHITIPDMSRGILAVSHYHAGVWILDITAPAAPKALGYYLPNGNGTHPHEGDIWWKKPNFDPDGFLPNVYQARWKDDLLWVSERGTGLYVLDYTGPVPGSLLPEAA